MFKKLFALAAAAALVTLPAIAGDDHAGHGHDHGDMSKQEMMAAMAEEMADCQVCSIMLPHMETFGPTMKMEIVTLNDGMACIHSVGDEHAALFHEVGAKMHEAGASISTMDEKTAAEKLCGSCQQIHKIMMAGAKMHHGTTANGDVMAFTSDDPKVQKMIAGVEAQWRAMMMEMEG